MLVERAGTDLPFLTPEWTLAWWEAFRQDRSVIRDSLTVKVLRTDAGQLVGVVPLMRTDRPGFGPARFRTLGFLGADHYLTEQRAPLVDPEHAAEAAAVLGSDLAGDPSWDWISWEGLDPAGAWAETLNRTLGLRWVDSQPGNVLDLPPTWDGFRAGLKRNIKESLRRCYNSLKRENLTPELEVAASPTEIGPALSIFFELHARRAGRRDTVAHPDRFADPRAREFLQRVCDRFARRSAARVFTLRVRGEAVASRVGFVLPGSLYLYYSGYDPSWAEYSVATTVVAEAIRHAIGTGFGRVHLSMGADVSKSRWGPRTPMFHSAVTVRPRARSRAALGLYSWARAGSTLLNPVKALLGR